MRAGPYIWVEDYTDCIGRESSSNIYVRETYIDDITPPIEDETFVAISRSRDATHLIQAWTTFFNKASFKRYRMHFLSRQSIKSL